MKRIFRAALWLALLTIALGAAAEDQYIDRIVAVVDNDIILASELQQYLQFAAGSQSALDAMSPATQDSLRNAILDELINQKVLLAKARLDTLVVDQTAVDRELDSRVKILIDQAGGQERLEDYYGMPLSKLKRQFRQMVEEGMLIEKVKGEKMRDVQVTPSEVQRFWEAYQDSIPPLKDALRISHILINDSLSQSSVDAAIAKADSVRNLVVSGQLGFETAASLYSEDPGTTAKGGTLGTTNRGDLVPEYEASAYMLEPGQISEPVVSVFGVHIIKLNERIGEKVNTSHILFKIVPTATDLAKTEAFADTLIQDIRHGASFDSLARLYSRDVKTASKGGDLGWFAPEELPEEFRGPLANLKRDELAPPIRTRFGVHIIMITDRMFARPITIKEDFERIKRMAQAKKQDEEFQAWIKELSGDTYIERKE
ncbi:MAG: peptidylprolyl isomerase [Calditrichota bacterium]